MQKKAVKTKNAPEAIGPYSQGIDTSSFVFTSGQLPINPTDGLLIKDNIKLATKQALENVKAILEEAGTSMDKVVKTTVFLIDLNDFAVMNEVYASFFTENYPARSAIQVAKLPLDAIIEIEAILIILSTSCKGIPNSLAISQFCG